MEVNHKTSKLLPFLSVIEETAFFFYFKKQLKHDRHSTERNVGSEVISVANCTLLKKGPRLVLVKSRVDAAACLALQRVD